ncbi:MAG: hypothetical protein D9V45_03960 [Chloroflexi bacterium]|nr:MAG: hypothetical protein D9V45_03960 [Chloroflexota bacterium]
MTFSAIPGETLLIPTPNRNDPNGARKHLNIIITDIDPVTGTVIIVGIESYWRGCDTTTVIRQGEHPSITHKTSVNYAKARIVEVTRLLDLVKNRFAIPQDPCSEELFKRIKSGIRRSPRTPNKIRERFVDDEWPF